MNIEGLRIVITGAGAGLGRALALALGRRGARVALVARTAGALEAVAAEVAAAGGEAHAIAGDVGDKEAIHRIAGQAMAALGGVDVLAFRGDQKHSYANPGRGNAVGYSVVMLRPVE